AREVGMVSMRMLKLVAVFAEAIARPLGRKPLLSREQLSFSDWDVRIDASKAQRELGFRPTPIEEGIARTFASFAPPDAADGARATGRDTLRAGDPRPTVHERRAIGRASRASPTAAGSLPFRRCRAGRWCDVPRSALPPSWRSAMAASPSNRRDRDFPELPFGDCKDTQETLHSCLQLVRMVRMALSAMQNHWWQVALYVTPGGLTTSPMPAAGGSLSIDFDFLSHTLNLLTSRGEQIQMELSSRSVAEFFRDVMASLRQLGVEVEIHQVPQEIE